MREIIITTTNSISGTEIEKYLGLVTTNLVIGTNVFSDFIASLSDFFGGMSGTYRNQLDQLYNRALEDLTYKANKKMADAILGIKIDFDEISGQGKSMFMVSITGTAVRFAHNKAIIEGKHITKEQLELQLFKNNWKNKPSNGDISSEEWDMIIENKLVELGQSLYDHYISAWQSDSKNTMISKFNQFLSSIGYKNAIEIIYKEYTQRYCYTDSLIRSHNLFSPKHILELISNGDYSHAIRLLKFDKNEYNPEDIILMRKILEELDNLPNKGAIENVKDSLFSSKVVERFVCSCGYKNATDDVYCSSCGQNIKGLVRSQVDTINNFKVKVETLEQLVK